MNDTPTPPELPSRVLLIGGSDSSGCSGLQADLRALGAQRAFGMTAVTALTVQDSQTVHQVSAVPAQLVERQLLAVLSDMGADCIKIGMLASALTVETVARVLETQCRGIPVVLDPVLSATSGAPLLDAEGLSVLRDRLMPLCALVTPNAGEAAELVGFAVRNEGDLHAAAERLLLLGQSAVLLKGGHLQGSAVVDLLRTADGLERRFESERQPRSPRGTGCALASAIAANLAHGHTLENAVACAHAFVAERIRQALPLGAGAPCLLGWSAPARENSEPNGTSLRGGR